MAENVTSESIVKTPNEHRPGHVPLRNVADLVYSDKFKNKIKHSRKSNIFTLATNEKSSRKTTNSKYDPIGSEMNECLGELKAAILGKSLQNRGSSS